MLFAISYFPQSQPKSYSPKWNISGTVSSPNVFTAIRYIAFAWILSCQTNRIPVPCTPQYFLHYQRKFRSHQSNNHSHSGYAHTSHMLSSESSLKRFLWQPGSFCFYLVLPDTVPENPVLISEGIFWSAASLDAPRVNAPAWSTAYKMLLSPLCSHMHRIFIDTFFLPLRLYMHYIILSHRQHLPIPIYPSLFASHPHLLPAIKLI